MNGVNHRNLSSVVSKTILTWLKGVTMKAYVLIKIHSGEVKSVVKELRLMEGVVNVDMTFGPYDAVAIIESPDISTLGGLVASSIQPISGVDQTLTCIAVDI